jgi:hypothetical protein
MTTTKTKRLALNSIATFQIKVQGCLEEIWSDRLAGMDISMDIKIYGDPVTTLEGQVRDQSELLGVLNGLYQLHMPILSIQLLSVDSPEEQPKAC